MREAVKKQKLHKAVKGRQGAGFETNRTLKIKQREERKGTRKQFESFHLREWKRPDRKRRNFGKKTAKEYTLVYREKSRTKALKCGLNTKVIKYNILESLILAQDERWRRA